MAWNVRRGASLGALAFVLTAAVPATAETTWGVSVNIGNAPPPPVVVVKEEPRLVMVPGTTVYIVNNDRYDYDCFRYGVYWYAWSDGFWYRSRNWRGPFIVVETRVVPRAIINVPARHWKHHPHGGPPGLTKKHRGHDDVVVVSKPRQNVVVVKEAPGKGGNEKGKSKGRGR
ncbi:MAG TPA: hypothetical protein VFV33_20055 [Gemmatimonadaceae bacterium]|nr:hypothetical protein [Gemmatimonadaceae bacterium]